MEEEEYEEYGSNDEIELEEDDDGPVDSQFSCGGFYDDPVEDVPEKLVEFSILSERDLQERSEEDIEKIAGLMDCPKPFARLLLMRYGWNSEKLAMHLVDRGREFVLKNAGIQEEKEEMTADECAEFTCPSCFEDVAFKDTAAASCGHRFCTDCLQSWISMKISEGQSRNIGCMQNKCTVLFDESRITRFCTGVLREKYNRSLLHSYVDDNPHVKWCTSAPHCGNAVFSDAASERQQVTVSCYCGHMFCFNCCNEPHAPASCEMFQLWSKKCSDDSETLNYLSANTKICPRAGCGKLIAKDGGCNLVQCRCGQCMCWLCGAGTGSAHTWEKIEGHSCGKYLESDEKKAADESRKSLQRYLHYYERYKANNEAKKFRAATVDRMKVAVETLRETSMCTETNLQRAERSVASLFQCRRILTWAYPFAYYLFGEDMKWSSRASAVREHHKNIFEHNLAELEKTVEILARHVEDLCKMTAALDPKAPSLGSEADKDLMCRIDTIISCATLSDKGAGALYEGIRVDILQDCSVYGYQISPYKPMM